MKEEKKHRFLELLKRREQLSKQNKEKIKTVSSDDPQLADIINNFNESKDYKMLTKK